jgi:type II secretory pathway component PulJ
MTPRRRGHSLIECSAVLFMLAATLATVTAILHTLYQADGRLRDELAQQLALERLAAQLRCDAHQASSATTGEAGNQPDSAAALLLVLPNQLTVQYTLAPQHVERVVRRAETVQHRESYDLPSATTARWRWRKGRMPLIVSLVLESRTGSEPGVRTLKRTYSIDAAVQLNQPRFPTSQP